MSIKHAFRQVRHYTLTNNVTMCTVNNAVILFCLFVHLFHGLACKTFLGGFPKLRSAIVSFIMGVCLSVRPSICAPVRPHGTTQLPLDCHEI